MSRQLGFVPVKEDLVVLLGRDVDVNATEYDWDLSKWAPLVQATPYIHKLTLYINTHAIYRHARYITHTRTHTGTHALYCAFFFGRGTMSLYIGSRYMTTRTL